MLLLLNFKKSSEYSDSILHVMEENVLIVTDTENYRLIFFSFSLLKILKDVTRKSFPFIKQEFVGAELQFLCS